MNYTSALYRKAKERAANLSTELNRTTCDALAGNEELRKQIVEEEVSDILTNLESKCFAAAKRGKHFAEVATYPDAYIEVYNADRICKSLNAKLDASYPGLRAEAIRLAPMPTHETSIFVYWGHAR